MKTSSKLKVFLIIFFIAIFAIIAARHFIGLHFKKKFSVRPAPGVIVEQVEKSLFYKSIETFGTAIAQNSKTYRIKTSEVSGKLNIENRFVKKGEVILRLKSGEEIIADFEGKLGKREIAQGVLGSESLIVTLDDLKKIVIDIKVPENYVSILKKGLRADITSSAFNKIFQGKIETISSRIDPSTRSILSRVLVDNSNFEIKDGITAELFIPTKKVQAHLIPPSSLTLDSEGKIGIRHISPNNEVIFSDVEIIGDEKELIWVTGLPEEITLITIGQEFVIEGQKVNYTLEVLN